MSVHVQLLVCFAVLFFFCNDTATTEIYTLSLHDALPISRPGRRAGGRRSGHPGGRAGPGRGVAARVAARAVVAGRLLGGADDRRVPGRAGDPGAHLAGPGPGPGPRLRTRLAPGQRWP